MQVPRRTAPPLSRWPSCNSETCWNVLTAAARAAVRCPTRPHARHATPRRFGPTTITYCTRAGADLLCHFDAGWKDCFLIVVCPAAASLPLDHLLFDIGAEYRPTVYHDLSTGFVGEPTEELLAESLPQLGAGGTPAAILGRGEGSYLQTYLDAPNRYTME